MTITPRRTPLDLWLQQVDEARAELQRLRCAVEPKKAEVAAAQRRFRRALEAYAAAAEANRRPMPHRLRVELIVYRSLDQGA